MENDNEFRFSPPIFIGYMAPNGWLTDNPATHACFNYYLCARNTYETVELNPVVYEGDDDPVANYANVWKNIARMYNVELGAMAQCWDVVDKQCDLLHLPRLPDTERYRHNAVQIITTTQH